VKELAVYHTLFVVFWLYQIYERGPDSVVLFCTLMQAFVAWCQWERYRRGER
jgi:hypothetical protein